MLRDPVIDLSDFVVMYNLILLNFFTVHSKNLSTEYPRNIPETYSEVNLSINIFSRDNMYNYV